MCKAQSALATPSAQPCTRPFTTLGQVTTANSFNTEHPKAASHRREPNPPLQAKLPPPQRGPHDNKMSHQGDRDI